MKTVVITYEDNPNYLATITFSNAELQTQYITQVNCENGSNAMVSPYLYLKIKDEYDVGESIFTPDDRATFQLVAADKQTQDAIDKETILLPENSQGISIEPAVTDNAKFGAISIDIHAPSIINFKVIMTDYTEIPECYKITYDISQIETLGNNAITGGKIDSITIVGGANIYYAKVFDHFISINFDINVNYVMYDNWVIIGQSNIKGPNYILDIIDTKTGDLVMSINDKFYPRTISIPVSNGLTKLTLDYTLLNHDYFDINEIKKVTNNHQLTFIFKYVIFPTLITRIQDPDPEEPVS